MRAKPPSPSRPGFTLIELLVVIAIIAVLASLLMPAVSGALGSARSVACRNKLRQIGMGFMLFAADYNDILPGNHLMTGPAPWQWEWLGREVWAEAPQPEGTLVPYIGGVGMAPRLYRCPGLSYSRIHSGSGSNGQFDYAALGVFAGAPALSLPLEASWSGSTYPCPLIVEEDPAAYINSSEVEPAHGGPDQIAQTHNGRGNYCATDGSVHDIDAGPLCWSWTARGPSGAETSLNYTPHFYGQWRDR